MLSLVQSWNPVAFNCPCQYFSSCCYFKVYFPKRILYSIFCLESTDELLQLGMFYTLGGIFDKQKCKDNQATTDPKYIFLNITSSIYIQILKVLLSSFLTSNVMIPKFFISKQQISSNKKKKTLDFLSMSYEPKNRGV